MQRMHNISRLWNTIGLNTGCHIGIHYYREVTLVVVTLVVVIESILLYDNATNSSH